MGNTGTISQIRQFCEREAWMGAVCRFGHNHGSILLCICRTRHRCSRRCDTDPAPSHRFVVPGLAQRSAHPNIRTSRPILSWDVINTSATGRQEAGPSSQNPSVGRASSRRIRPTRPSRKRPSSMRNSTTLPPLRRVETKNARRQASGRFFKAARRSGGLATAHETKGRNATKQQGQSRRQRHR